MKKTSLIILILTIIGHQTFISCTSDIEIPPSPTQQDNSISSTGTTQSSSSSLPIGTVLCSYNGSCIAIIEEDCSALGGQAVQNCPTTNSSSSAKLNSSSSSNSGTTSGSSSSIKTEPTYYCDYGLRYTCPSCSGGVGGGCFEMENQYAECDLRYGRVTTSCSIGLVCDWGPRYYDASHSSCGTDYCGGCYIIGSNNNITQASCERDDGTVRSSCPESSLVLR